MGKDQTIEEGLEEAKKARNDSVSPSKKETAHAEKLSSLKAKNRESLDSNKKVSVMEIRRFLTNAYTFIGSVHLTEMYLAYDLRQAVTDRIEEISGTPRVLARKNRLERVEHLMRAAETYIKQAMDMDPDVLSDEALNQASTATSSEGVLSEDKGGGLGSLVKRAKTANKSAMQLKGYAERGVSAFEHIEDKLG